MTQCADAASSARLSSSTLTRGSPSTPNWRPSVCRATSACTCATSSLRALATRAAWYCAAAGLIWGSRPLADAVTRSTGTAAVLPGSTACSAAMRCFTASVSAGLVGPRFEPDDDAALYGFGVVADGRPQKYPGPVNDWPISAEPTGLRSCMIRLPLAWRGNSSCASPVAASG